MEPTDLERKLKTRTRAVHKRLIEAYGAQSWTPHGDPIDELVATILSQNTSDTNSMRAFAALKARYPTWPEVITAPAIEVASAIRGGGLANIKAPRIQIALRGIFDQFPDGDLKSLRNHPVTEARELLCALPGVGMKTSSCVLLFSLGMPAMPVDTHVHRVAQRTGIIGPKTSADAAHGILEQRLGNRLDTVYSFHLNVIRHGRETCKARSPRCGECRLADICDYNLSQHHE